MVEKENNVNHDCSRGCCVERTEEGALEVNYAPSCCKLADFNWLEGISSADSKDLYEVRFKNTRKVVFRNDSGQALKPGDIVVTEAATGHDVGIVTLEGPVVLRQLVRHRIDPSNHELRKIYRQAKILDIERWQEAIAREHKTMIRSRQIAAKLGLDMKIGDVEFQGDGTKAIFYYIADERVDFRQLIKDFAEEFHIRIEMKQIGARQEAGLIGGIGVCGRPLCCSGFMADFQSITTQAARCQDLSLNPQKLAGQCSKLKCCINYEASVYLDARKDMPDVRNPLEFQDGLAYLVKTEPLKRRMLFSYEKGNLAKVTPLSFEQVFEIQELNRRGIRPETNNKEENHQYESEFVSAVGDESITRFDEARKKKRNRNRHKENEGERKHGDRPKEGRKDHHQGESQQGERAQIDHQKSESHKGEHNHKERRQGEHPKGDRPRGDRPKGGHHHKGEGSKNGASEGKE